MRDPVTSCLQLLRLILVALVVIIVMMASKAKAQEHSHAAHDRLHHWYSKLMRPDMPSVSCCSSRDCTVVKARLTADGQWEFLKGTRWVRVPQTKINSEESLDTQAHACYHPGTENDDSILCFVRPGAGI